VREGTQWYVSQTAIAAGAADKVLSFATDDSDGNWAPVNPAANLNLNLTTAAYAPQNFVNLTGFGYYLENDAQTNNVSFYAVVDAFQVEVSPLLPPFAAWQSTHWPGETASGTLGPNADPDNDGLTNFFEYALNRNPLVASPGTLTLLLNSENFPELSFLRARPELSYEVEAASNLAPDSWTVIATNPGSASLSIPVTVTDPQALLPNIPRFFRLVIKP
jgi:hypothetical protein